MEEAKEEAKEEVKEEDEKKDVGGHKVCPSPPADTEKGN